MTALDHNIDNENFLSPLGFKFQIKKCPTVNFYVQNVNLPGISMTEVGAPTPFVSLPYAGDHIRYDELILNFKVDEEMKNYIEIHEWIKQLGFPNNYDEYKTIASHAPITGMGIKSDISLLVLNSSRNPKMDIIFKDAFPVGLSSLIFDSTASDVNYLEASATFVYSSYDITLI